MVQSYESIQTTQTSFRIEIVNILNRSLRLTKKMTQILHLFVTSNLNHIATYNAAQKANKVLGITTS